MVRKVTSPASSSSTSELTGVQRVYLKARVVTTIGPDDKRWRRMSGDAAEWGGAIVRLLPPSDATESQIDALRSTLTGLGASVKLGPRAAAPAVVKPRAHAERVTKTARQHIADLIAESRCDDLEQLEKIVEAAIAPEGL